MLNVNSDKIQGAFEQHIRGLDDYNWYYYKVNIIATAHHFYEAGVRAALQNGTQFLDPPAPPLPGAPPREPNYNG